MKGNFQLIVIIVFIAAAIFGVLVFSGVIPLGKSGGTTASGTVVLWGTTSANTMAPLLTDFNNANQAFKVVYVEKSADTFDQDLLEALADGKGPDMFFLPDNLAFHYANKIFTIPYASYPLASFENNFAGAGEVFLTAGGVLAFPMTIDPLLMYYNRSTLDAAGIVAPPAYWDDFIKLVPTLTPKDDSNKILKSATALGQFSNVTNAKDILSALFMQAGNSIVAAQNGLLSSTLDTPGSTLSSVLNFYTSFADPNQTVYSWNKSFPDSTDAFSAGNVAFYFGFASELSNLIQKNPNENFLAAPFPQIRNAAFKLTDAHVTGLAISSASKNFNTAFTAASLMANGDFAGKYALALGVAPARRDLLAVKPTDVYGPTFYNSALYAKSWLDPSSSDTDTIFQLMVENVLSNNMTANNAIDDASSKLNLLLETQQD